MMMEMRRGMTALAARVDAAQAVQPATPASVEAVGQRRWSEGAAPVVQPRIARRTTNPTDDHGVHEPSRVTSGESAEYTDARMSELVASAPPFVVIPEAARVQRAPNERPTRRPTGDDRPQVVSSNDKFSEILSAAIFRSEEAHEKRPKTFGGESGACYTEFRLDFHTKARRYKWSFSKHRARLYDAIDSRVLVLVEDKLGRVMERDGVQAFWEVLDNQFMTQDGAVSQSQNWRSLKMTSPTQPLGQFLVEFEVAAHHQGIRSETTMVEALIDKVHPALKPLFVALRGSDMATAKKALASAQRSYVETHAATPQESSVVAAVQPTTTEAKSRACYECKSTAHLARDCPNRRECHRCGGLGHVAAKCYVKFPFCPWCGEQGHQPHECPARATRKPQLKFSKTKTGFKKSNKTVAAVAGQTQSQAAQPSPATKQKVNSVKIEAAEG